MKRVAFFVAACAATCAAITACLGDGEERVDFQVDGGPPVALPDAAPPIDSSGLDARAPFDPAEVAVVCDASVCVTQITAGKRHFCARIHDGTVRCWGDDAKGQCGTGDAGAPKQPLPGLAGVTQISAGGDTTCARRDDGRVLCWGANDEGELGRATKPPFDDARHPTPEPVAWDGGAARVDVGQGAVCSIDTEGRATCWGNGDHERLARDGGAGPGEPPAIAALPPSRRVVLGQATGVALGTDGTLRTWGAVAGDDGVLAGRVSSVTPSTFPLPVLDRVTSFAVSGPTPATPPPGSFPGDPLPPPNQHACAVREGELRCWGKSERGAFGSGLPDVVLPVPLPVRFTTTAYPQLVAAGGETTCARMTDGTVWCTGENTRGQLGKGVAGPFVSTFTAALSFTRRAVQVAVSEETVCALDEGGTVFCWGGNSRGELGQGTRDDDAHPSAMPVAF